MSMLSVGRYFPASAPSQIPNEAPKTGVNNSANIQPGQAVPRLADASSRLQVMLKNCVKLQGGVLLLQRTGLQQSLQEAGFNPSSRQERAAQKKLITAGKNVTSAMKALDKLGCAAFMVDSPSRSATKALDKVITTLMDLEQAVDSMADTIADNDPQAGRIHTALEGLRNACASRISETLTLTSALRVLGTAPGELEKTSFALKAADVQNKSLTQCMSEMALRMHGMDQTLESLSQDAEHLFARADQLEKNNATVSLTEFHNEATSLQLELTDLRTKAGSLSDSAELASLNTALEQMEEKLTMLRSDRGTHAMQNMAKAMFAPWPEDTLSNFKDKDKRNFLISIEKQVHDVGTQLQQALKTKDDGASLTTCLNKLDDLREQAQKSLKAEIYYLNGHVLGCKDAMFTLEKKQLVEAYRQVHNDNAQLRLDLLSTVLTSPHVGVSTLVEAQVRGIPARYLELGTNDAMLFNTKKLGSGACNDVLLCSYQDKLGEQHRVFKAEAEGARSFTRMTAVQALKVNYGETHLVELNIASCIAADVIGCGNVLAKSTIGVHRDAFGLFMETAPGKSGFEFARSGALQSLHGKKELYSKACGNLQRELNKLEWADLLSGQLDRHGANYFINLNPKTGEVKVTGIDNDMAFPHGSILSGVAKMSKDVVAKFAPRLLTSMADSIEVKLNELSGSEIVSLRHLTGLNHINRPEYIDINVYEKLVAVDVEAYRTQLLDCLHDPKAVETAVKRLTSAQELAQELYIAGKVMDNTAWSDPKMLDEARSSYKNTLARHPADLKKTGEERMRLLTKGFFVRDLVSQLG